MRRRGVADPALLPALCAAAVVLTAVPAQASSFDTFGFGARATARAGAMAASGTNYSAIYYNPANLLNRKAAHIGLGVNLIVPDMHFDRLSGADEMRVHMPGTNLGVALGASTPIGGVFEDRLAFGATLFHPLVQLTRIESIDPSDAHFYRYQSLPDKLILAMALAGEPWEYLRLGVGIQILAGLGGRVSASLSLAEGRFTEETIDLDVGAAAAPTAGLSLGPLVGLRLGVTWRSELSLAYRVPIDVMLEEIGEMRVLVDGVSLYTPDQLAWGLSWESAPDGEPGWTVEAGMTWERWSQAPPAAAEFIVAVDDSVLRAREHAEDDRETQNLIDVRAEAIPLGARDIFIPRVGGEWRPTPEWAVRAGYLFRPTPLPRPIHQTNTLDSAAHVISLGAGYMFADPLRLARSPLHIDLAVQLTALHQRTVTKASTGTPDGAYAFGGFIWNVALDIRHDW